MLVYFEQKENGVCLTPCPFGVECMVNSLACTQCHYHFGMSEKKVKCAGERLKKELTA